MGVFEITIQRKDSDDWPVVVRHQPGAQALAQWSRGRLDLDLARLEALRPTEKGYGTLLGQALFREEIRDAFVRALTGTSGGDEPLRVLLIVEADALRNLHWEQLCAPLDRGWDYLLLNQGTPFSLYLPSQIERRFPPIGRRDLRTLILVAGPEELADEEWGLAPFDVAATVHSIRDALGEIPADVLASVEGAAGQPTLNNLCERLTAGAPSGDYSLLHIVCHGAYHQATGETLLHFPQDEGLRPVPATEMIERLGRLRRLPHLTFLSTCESADPQAESGLGGLGQRLVRDLGMPAVVAMTDRISVDTAGALASAFYARLRECGEVDCALSEALVGLQGRDDVTVPALFSRLGGRALFSDALDRPLTEAEIGYGLAQMRALIEQRAPVLLDEAERQAAIVQSTLGTDPTALSAEARRERQAALAAANQLCSQALDLSFNALALGQPPPAYDGRCPFRGLFPFRAEDREFFFGRQALVDKLSGRLMEHRFLAVLGPSGCGKSSLVLAGVVPALQARFPRLRVAYLTPGSEPLAQLEAALSGAGGGDGKPNLIVVDQFEELFTLCRHEGERQGFVDRLLALSAGTALVLTLRADFWGECAAYGALKEEMQAHQELVAPMDASALRRAMEHQADHVGLRFEAGLGEAILDDVEGEPGAMPLLQHALLLLWQRRHGRWLRWEEYRAIGGIQQAIAHTADEVYLGLVGQEQARMRDIFLRLTRLEDAPAGAEARDTRRRVGLAELVPAGSEPAGTVALVKRLADARLVVTSLNAASGQEEVEVAHEALIRHWPRLRDWLEEDRAELHLREGVREAALEWEANEQDEAYLVHRGGRLEDAQALRRQPRFALNKLEQAYVKACVELQERERREKEEQQRRELEAARKLAAEQQARAEDQTANAARMRRRAVGIGAVGMVALVLAVLAVVLWLRAEEQRRVALSQALTIDAADLEQRGQIDLAFLLSAQAYQVAPTDRAKQALYNLLRRNQNLEVVLPALEGETREPPKLAFNEAGTRLVAQIETYDTLGNPVTKYVLWDLEDREQVDQLELPEGHAGDIWIDASGNKLLAEGGAERIPLDKAVTATSAAAETLGSAADRLYSGPFVGGPNDDMSAGVLCTAYPARNICTEIRVILARSTSRFQLQTLPFDDGEVLALAYDTEQPLSLWVLTRVVDSSTLHVWKVDGESMAPLPTLPLPSFDPWPNHLTFSPEAGLIAWQQEGKLSVWSTQNQKVLAEHDLASQIYDLALSPDGETLALVEDSSILLRSLTDSGLGSGSRLEIPVSLAPATGLWTVVEFSGDGRTLVLHVDGSVGVWHLPQEEPLRRFSLPDSPWHMYSGLAVDYDGGTIAIGMDPTGGGTVEEVMLVDVATGLETGRFEGYQVPALSPDGSRLAAASMYVERIAAWDMDPAHWVQWACEIAHRNLTEDEWRQYLPGEKYRKKCGE